MISVDYKKWIYIFKNYVYFSDAPRVDLTLGKSISPGSIYEGGDVYFDCLVIASPKPYKILWFQDVSFLHIHTVDINLYTNIIVFIGILRNHLNR